MSVIASNTVATIHYTLRGDDGEVLDTSVGGDPLSYLHGHDNIVPGLERQLTDRAVGDRLTAIVEPAEGYGERRPDGRRSIERAAFPADVQPGMQLFAEDGEGRVLPIWVRAVGEQEVEIDLDHPLAGARLHFEVEVLEVRAANAEELTHGHPHGRHGDAHHH